MSGHSKWSTIKRKKEKTDNQRAKIFTKIGREIAVAVREGGPDPASNSKLKDIISKAKANNVPNDNIDRIIKKAAGDGNADNYEEIMYEGYGPSGIAVIVETLTDNRNRTAGDMRHYFDKFGGNMGQSGCVSFMFSKQGVIVIEKDDDIDEEKLMEDALEAGAIDFLTDDGVYDIRTEPNDFSAICEDLEKKGYTFLGWFTKDGVRITRIGAEATGDVTVYAHWTLDALYPSVLDAIFGDMDFSDVSPRDWFYKDVEYVYEKGIMDGIDKHTFAPDANLTRGMLVTILYRIEGEPVTRGSTDFTDVELGRWYTKAVAWAASKDIVNGYGGGKFGPNDPVTREQLTTILYRYTAYKGESTTAFPGNLNRFKDAASVSNYAVDAANWAVGEGLVNGSGDLFMPKSNATRAQVAAIIHRYLAG